MGGSRVCRVDRNVGGTDGKGVAKKIKTRQELKTIYTCKHGNMDNHLARELQI